MIKTIKFNKLKYNNNTLPVDAVNVLLCAINAALPNEGEGVIVQMDGHNFCIFKHNDDLIIEATDIDKQTGTVVKVKTNTPINKTLH